MAITQAPTTDSLVELRYMFLKRKNSELVNRFECALLDKIEGEGGRAVKIDCFDWDEFDFLKSIIVLLEYPNQEHIHYDEKRNKMTFYWR